MNRRSFLLGLVTVPLAGVAVATPTSAVGIDCGGADGRVAVSLITKGVDHRGQICWEEVHTLMQPEFMESYQKLARALDTRNSARPEGFIVVMKTTRG